MARQKSPKKKVVLPRLSEYAKNMAVVRSDLGESMLLYDQRSENVYVLSVAAKLIWLTFDKDCTFDDLLAVLRRWFTAGVTREEATQAVATLFEELIKVSLILPRSDPIAGFPVGLNVRINQSAKNVRFQPPTMQAFTKDFLRANHPTLVAPPPCFADQWGLVITSPCPF